MTKYEAAAIERDLGLSVLGDSEKTAMATNAFAELVKAGGGIYAAKQQGDEKAAKDAKLKVATEAAVKARNAANIAQMKAMSEQDPYGPLHIAAMTADVDARQLESAAGMSYGGGSMVPYGSSGMQQYGNRGSNQNFLTKNAGGLPVWGWGLVAVAGAGVLYGVIKLAGRK